MTRLQNVVTTNTDQEGPDHVRHTSQHSIEPYHHTLDPNPKPVQIMFSTSLHSTAYLLLHKLLRLHAAQLWCWHKR